jgi:anti-sigma B factor antagonist
VTDEGVSVRTRQAGETTVVELAGEIDLSNVHQLQQQLEAAIEGSPNVVLDLTGIEYLDSQGLRLIKLLRDRADRSGRAFSVVAPRDGFARQVLELSRLDEYVRIRDSFPG